MAKGATPLDFAYRIHSAVGNKCVGAKVNGKIVPLDTTLETGDRVEIMTSASCKGPSSDWLRICKTPQAKAKIRQFLKQVKKEENIELGKNMIDKECRRRGVTMSDLMKPELYDGLLRKYGFQEINDVYSAVGFGGMAAMYVVSRLMDESRAQQAAQAVEELPSVEQHRNTKAKANHGIIMPGNEDLDIPVRFARCCSPVPGDFIVGYITRGRGVTIHKAECINAVNGEKERQIDVAWADTDIGSFAASIKVVAYDHVSLLGEIAMYIGEMNVPIKAVSAQADDKTKTSTIRLVLEVRSRDQMDRVIKSLRKKSDIIDVYRTQV